MFVITTFLIQKIAANGKINESTATRLEVLNAAASIIVPSVLVWIIKPMPGIFD